MKLYKYFAPERIDVLQNLKIRFTQPIAFNDPFESKPHVVYDISKEQMRRVAEVEFERSKMPEDQRDHMRQALERGDLDKRWPEALGLMMYIMASSTLALSLTEKAENLLMWAHYSRNHEGFVLGFDSNHSFFASKGKGIYKLTKIVYSTMRPSVGLSRLSLTDTYFTKSVHWAYEQEWRLFREVEDATLIIREGKYPICLFDLPADAITEVILGCRTSEGLKASVLSALNSSPKVSHIELKQAVINEEEYKLDMYQIKAGGNPIQ